MTHTVSRISNESISSEQTVNSAPLPENEKGTERSTLEVNTSEAESRDAEQSFRKMSSETDAGEVLTSVAGVNQQSPQLLTFRLEKTTKGARG